MGGSGRCACKCVVELWRVLDGGGRVVGNEGGEVVEHKLEFCGEKGDCEICVGR